MHKLFKKYGITEREMKTIMDKSKQTYTNSTTKKIAETPSSTTTIGKQNSKRRNSKFVDLSKYSGPLSVKDFNVCQYYFKERYSNNKA